MHQLMLQRIPLGHWLLWAGKGENLMVWPPSSPDLNPIENLWSIIKQKIYEGGRQFTSKQQLWEAILTFWQL